MTSTNGRAPEGAFQLAPQLQRDTHAVTRLALCSVRLLNDARFPWLVLIPRLPDAREVHRLTAEQQRQLIDESSHAAAALEALYRPDKINLGALGNLVPQLHWHVVARFVDDPCWPGPVWGCGQAMPYGPAELEIRIGELRGALEP